MKSTGLYIHIPFCECKCHYCDFNSGPSSETIKSDYMKALVKELIFYKEVLRSMKVQTLFIGGGTPTSVPPYLFEPLLKALQEIVDFDKVSEFTIEANPGTVDEEKLLLYKKYGINRISFGVQSFNNHLLKRIGRIHNREQAIQSIQLAQSVGFKNINIDLMHNLPEMREVDLYESVTCAMDLGITHLSLYSLIIEEGTPLFREFKEKGLPLFDEETERNVFHKALNLMHDKGFKRYEVSNFSLDNNICSHNMMYWTIGDYVGLGVGSHGKINHQRYHNTGSITNYIKGIARGEKPIAEKENLSLEEEAFEMIMLGLRLIKGIDLKNFEKRFGFSIESRYEQVIYEQIKQKTLKIENGYLFLTPYGHDIANNVIIEFMD